MMLLLYALSLGCGCLGQKTLEQTRKVAIRRIACLDRVQGKGRFALVHEFSSYTQDCQWATMRTLDALHHS